MESDPERLQALLDGVPLCSGQGLAMSAAAGDGPAAHHLHRHHAWAAPVALASEISAPLLAAVTAGWSNWHPRGKLNLLFATLCFGKSHAENADIASETRKLFDVAVTDDDEWVRLTANMLKPCNTAGRLNATVEEFDPNFKATLERTSAMLEHADSSRIPPDFAYLDSSLVDKLLAGSAAADELRQAPFATHPPPDPGRRLRYIEDRAKKAAKPSFNRKMSSTYLGSSRRASETSLFMPKQRPEATDAALPTSPVATMLPSYRRESAVQIMDFNEARSLMEQAEQAKLRALNQEKQQRVAKRELQKRESAERSDGTKKEQEEKFKAASRSKVYRRASSTVSAVGDAAAMPVKPEGDATSNPAAEARNEFLGASCNSSKKRQRTSCSPDALPRLEIPRLPPRRKSSSATSAGSSSPSAASQSHSTHPPASNPELEIATSASPLSFETSRLAPLEPISADGVSNPSPLHQTAPARSAAAADATRSQAAPVSRQPVQVPAVAQPPMQDSQFPPSSPRQSQPPRCSPHPPGPSPLTSQSLPLAHPPESALSVAAPSQATASPAESRAPTAAPAEAATGGNDIAESLLQGTNQLTPEQREFVRRFFNGELPHPAELTDENTTRELEFHVETYVDPATNRPVTARRVLQVNLLTGQWRKFVRKKMGKTLAAPAAREQRKAPGGAGLT